MSKVILKMQNITKYIFDAYGKPIHGTDVKILKDVNFDVHVQVQEYPVFLSYQ